MKSDDVKKLGNGFYRIFWKRKFGGGSSLAAVGTTPNGGKWMAPLNWVHPTEDQEYWRKVKHALLICD
jgi:hypothetical protein